MANPNDIAFGTVASTAERAQIRPSAIVRFAQALGYEGFSELQAVFRDRLRERVPTYRERLRSLHDPSDAASRVGVLLEGFAIAAESSARALRESMSREALDATVALLSASETIFLVGQRRSHVAIAHLNFALTRLGIKNIVVGPIPGSEAEQLSFATPSDTAIVMSFRPTNSLLWKAPAS